MIAFQFRVVWQLTVRSSRESGKPGVVGVNVGYVSRPPNSERYRLFPLAKLTEHVYYYKHMAHRSHITRAKTK